jgi:hypothetical protein
MTDLLIYIADNVKSKSFYPLVRQGFNLVFISSITKYILSKTHPEVEIPNTLEYQRIVDFCIEGYFFIPFAIYFIVYLATKGISTGLFMWLGDLKNHKLTRRILAFQLEKNDLKEGFEGIDEVAQKVAVLGLTKEKLLELYTALKPRFNTRNLTKVLNKLEDEKDNLNNNFAMVLRGWLAVTIYFSTIPSFGLLLYLLSSVSIVICLAIFILGYKLADILPHVMKKAIEAEKIYKE